MSFYWNFKVSTRLLDQFVNFNLDLEFRCLHKWIIRPIICVNDANGLDQVVPPSAHEI